QLRTLVLPAPFGPIKASNSPASTCSDTSVSTVRPPKWRERCSTVSSAMWASLPRRMPQRTIAPALLAAGLAHIGLLDFGPAAQIGAGTFKYDAAVLKDVAIVGDGKRDTDILLHSQNRNTEFPLYAGYAPCKVFDQYRCQAQRQLVHQQQLGLAYNSAAES